MVEEVRELVNNNDLKDRVEVFFIDIMEDDLTLYPEEKKLIERGYQLPLTFLNGKLGFYGKIDTNRLLIALKSMK
ncbi:hypothetical protein F8154_12360 [Alkaliphilus pronyensis]|uniref:Glutaredoxin n=1 Tax=Alkaliphilus pronyensis TaxID=1482732 RepID=A0A6I0EXH5_9FIRM|nr:hypothetical protein [Alkaliphilus pronyensis]KAB3531897.1 hypothetical protein F8154_12360 [Alkaliphilus pronyensis]